VPIFLSIASPQALSDRHQYPRRLHPRQRYEKGLHPYEIGKKMGIAGSLVLAWERGESEPDEAQWTMLGRLLSFDAGVDLPKPHR